VVTLAYIAAAMASDWPSDGPVSGFATVFVKTLLASYKPRGRLAALDLLTSSGSIPCEAKTALSTRFCKHELPLGSRCW